MYQYVGERGYFWLSYLIMGLLRAEQKNPDQCWGIHTWIHIPRHLGLIYHSFLFRYTLTMFNTTYLDILMMQQIDCGKQFRKCRSASPITNINAVNICFTFIDTNISVMITVVNLISQRTTSRHWIETITSKGDSIIISYYLHFINQLCARFFAGIRGVALLLNRQQVFFADIWVILSLSNSWHAYIIKEQRNSMKYDTIDFCMEETREHVSCRVITSLSELLRVLEPSFDHGSHSLTGTLPPTIIPSVLWVRHCSGGKKKTSPR